MRTLLVTSNYSPSRVLPFGIVFPSALLWDSVNPRLSEGEGRGKGAGRYCIFCSWESDLRRKVANSCGQRPGRFWNKLALPSFDHFINLFF